MVKGERISVVNLGVTCVDKPSELLKLAREHKKRGGKVVLEVGCGGKFSLNLGENCLDIGVDPDMVKVDTGGLSNKRGAKRVVFAEKTDVLPIGLNPDVVLIVAPCPDDIEEILVGLETVVQSGETQFLILLEDESVEAASGKNFMAKAFARHWLQKMGLRHDVDDEIIEDPDECDSACSFNTLLQEIGLESGVLKSSKFGRESCWIAIVGYSQ